MKMNERLYFAYGSNINLDQMARRCPNAEVIGPVTLNGYRLAFRAQSGVATIIPAPAKQVKGLLWRLTPECEKSLDHYEGHPHFYYKDERVIKERIAGQSLDSYEEYFMRENSHSKRPPRKYSVFHKTTLRSVFSMRGLRGLYLHYLYRMGVLPKRSGYIDDDKDVLRLITNLIKNTTPKGVRGSDPFWEKAETALLQALMLYLVRDAPEEERNFQMILEMISRADVREDNEDHQSTLDLLFERLEIKNPNSIALKQYKVFKQSAGKTAKSILISAGVRLAAFNLPEIAGLTCVDEMDLASIGEKKTAVFCCIPDSDTSLNYLVGLLYTQCFQTLYNLADRKYNGRLPVHVHFVMDEWANVSMPDDFEKLLSTMRSREISVSIIVQNIAQIKALFKDSHESLIGNCDSLLFLGGNEQSTHKYISESLGKSTIDTNTYGQTKGRNGSYSTNFQQGGRELLQPDEVRMLDNRYAIYLLRGERPMLDEKYDLLSHPNIKLTTDGGAPPYDHTLTPHAAETVHFDPDRHEEYELLTSEDILKPDKLYYHEEGEN